MDMGQIIVDGVYRAIALGAQSAGAWIQANPLPTVGLAVLLTASLALSRKPSVRRR